MKNLCFASLLIYFTPETKIDQLKFQIMMQPEKIENAAAKDLPVIAGVAMVLFIIFSFLAFSEFQESLK